MKIRLLSGEVDRRVLVVGIDAELGLVTCVWNQIGNTASRGDFWFQPKVLTRLRVVTENK